MQVTVSVMPWAVSVMGEDGTYTRDQFFVTAVLPTGRRFAHYKMFDRADDAFKLEGRVRDAVRAETFSVNNEYWTEMQPVYGSDAYSAGGGDRAFDRVTQLAAEGRHREAELEAQHEDSFRGR